ncbi:MAG: PD-(D/E)XK motif protein [Pseudomonadota bacterium]
MNQIGSLWKDLAEEQPVQPGWHTRRVFPDGRYDIHAAILQPDVTPALLIEVASPTVPPDVDYPSSRGFELFPELVIPGPNGRVRLCLLLSDRVYREVFEVLCQDVAETIIRAFSEPGAIQSMLSRLRVWQGFMKRYGPEGLSLEEQTGLFAELSFLRDSVVGQMPAQDAVESWKGPTGGVQDFQFPGCSVEVKSTTVLPVGNIKISSLSQMDDTRVRRLFLCHMTLDTGSVSGLTLPEVVQDLRNILSTEDEFPVIRFNDRLLEAGYLNVHEGLYSGRRYVIREVLFFEVAGDFPRIRATEVRRGVASGSYSIEFSACLPFEANTSRVRSLMLER